MVRIEVAAFVPRYVWVVTHPTEANHFHFLTFKPTQTRPTMHVPRTLPTVFGSDSRTHKHTLREAVRTAGARMAHFLPLLPNESHKEHEASIFQRSHQPGCSISL